MREIIAWQLVEFLSYNNILLECYKNHATFLLARRDVKYDMPGFLSLSSSIFLPYKKLVVVSVFGVSDYI